MKTLIQAVAMVLFASSTAQGQQAVQWRVQDGGNGHWYAIVRAPEAICWDDARLACIAVGGHLVVITNAAENMFVRDQVVRPADPGTSELGPYMGASCEGVEWLDWRWVTGEPFVFSAFGASEPNSGGSERYLHFWHYPGSLHWNDCIGCDLTRSYAVEWETDCNADGIVDYGQILQGQLPDTNTNGVPDGCECSTSPTLPACCTGDLNKDRFVDGADLGILLNAWGACPGTCPADFNRDGFVDGSDLGTLLGRWGGCP
jgi:hypothetical protein